MTILNVLILSIIEGLTEFLPISSTGHLIIAQHLLQIPTSEFTKSFEIIIQLAAISAVTFKFRNEIISSKKHWGKIATAFIPTGVIGFVLYKLIKHYLLGNILVTIVSLLLGGIAIYLFEKNYKSSNYNKKIDDLNTKDLVTIGLFQSLSVIPGVSRSAS